MAISLADPWHQLLRDRHGATYSPAAPLEAIQEEILALLIRQEATYARPVSSAFIGDMLNVTPSYVREQAGELVRRRLIGVRRGRGGGYYLQQQARQLLGIGAY